MRHESDERIDRGRRAFLRGGAFRPGASERRRPLGPLPPAPIAACLSGNPCVGCAAPCVPACQPGIIRRHPAGHALADVPYLSFEESGCTFCNECVECCPETTGEEPLPARLGRALLDQEACVAWDGVVCMSCQLACPHEAVVMEHARRPTIDPDACNGCGFCVAGCPTHAVRVAW